MFLKLIRRERSLRIVNEVLRPIMKGLIIYYLHLKYEVSVFISIHSDNNNQALFKLRETQQILILKQYDQV